MVHVCGHIHAARGVEHVRWGVEGEGGSLVESVDYWENPGVANKKLSLCDLTGKIGRRLDNVGRGICHGDVDDVRNWLEGQAVVAEESERGSQKGVWRKRGGSAVEFRPQCDADCNDDGESVDVQRNETAMVNAAFLGERGTNNAREFHKPIIIDIDLPVYS